jgi:hypothetical protein
MSTTAKATTGTNVNGRPGAAVAKLSLSEVGWHTFRHSYRSWIGEEVTRRVDHFREEVHAPQAVGFT